mmetsp:Transcript_72/g.128  ORF Transcript_72/g.128 Transcript_72/m.128 type:complete len:405 (-) Transcript_72:177-1391(-)
MMGVIPIIQHSPLDDAYAQLPVIFVDRWANLFPSAALLLDAGLLEPVEPIDPTSAAAATDNNSRNSIRSSYDDSTAQTVLQHIYASHYNCNSSSSSSSSSKSNRVNCSENPTNRIEIKVFNHIAELIRHSGATTSTTTHSHGKSHGRTSSSSETRNSHFSHDKDRKKLHDSSRQKKKDDVKNKHRDSSKTPTKVDKAKSNQKIHKCSSDAAQTRRLGATAAAAAAAAVTLPTTTTAVLPFGHHTVDTTSTSDSDMITNSIVSSSSSSSSSIGNGGNQNSTASHAYVLQMYRKVPGELPFAPNLADTVLDIGSRDAIEESVDAAKATIATTHTTGTSSSSSSSRNSSSSSSRFHLEADRIRRQLQQERQKLIPYYEDSLLRSAVLKRLSMEYWVSNIVRKYYEDQ